MLREVGVYLVTLGLAALIDAVIGQAQQAAVVVVLGGVALALRRRWPLVAAAMPVVAMTWSQGAGVVLLVLCYGAGRRVTHRAHLYGWLGGCATAATAIVVLSWLRGAHELLTVVAGQVAGLALVVALPMLAGVYRAQRQALHAALRDRAERAERERAIVAEQARLRERTRIAQDMHDALGHQLALVSLQAASLEVDTTLGDEQRATVRQLGATARAAMEELRAAVAALHPPDPAAGAVDRAAQPRSRRDLDALIERARAAGLHVHLVQDGEEQPLSMPTQHALFRVVQESLTNAHKHAPGAVTTVSLRYEPGTLVAEIRNRRPATPSSLRAAPGDGQGIIGMRERVRVIGGLLRAGIDGADYRVVAILPYEAAVTEPVDPPPAERQAAAAPPAGPAAVEEFLTDPTNASRRRPSTRRAMTCVLLLFAGGVLVSTASNTSYLSRDVYDAVQVGQPEQVVTSRLPRPLLESSPTSGGTPSEGARCLVFRTTPADADEERRLDSGYRLCFRDGTLVDKREVSL
jgi:signal transduction histidine kinase